MSSELLNALDAQSTLAEAAAAATAEDKAERDAWAKGSKGLAGLATYLSGAVKLPDDLDIYGADNALAFLTRVVAHNTPAGADFNRAEGEKVVKAINMVKDLPGIMDAEAVKVSMKRWIDATASLPKTSGGGTPGGERVTREGAGFKVFWQEGAGCGKPGTVHSNKPAGEKSVGTRVNEARSAWGWKNKSHDGYDEITEALRPLMEDGTGEAVTSFGKVWAEAL